jgi:branched-chain amino acid transport system substrate-binding protein
MLKKGVSFVICLVMAAAVLTGCPDKNSKDSKTIKIGAVLPLSGDAASYGQSSKKALELLVEETNKNNGLLSKQVEIVYEDDENKPENSAIVLQKLIKDSKISAVIGTVSSKGCISMGPIATQAKIPMITATATSTKVTQSGEFVFRTSFTDAFQGTALAKFATEDLKAKTAAVLYDATGDYSKELAGYFRDDFEKAGGKVVSFETYNTDDQDFNTQLAKIKTQNPEILLLPDYYNVVGIIAKQAKAQGITARLLGGDGWDSTDLYKIGGSAVNGGYFSSHYSAQNNSQEAVKFKNEYKAKYGKEPDADAALAYDAGTILLNAIKKAGSTSGAKIKKAMMQTELTGVTGTIKFDENRDPIKSADIIKIDNGKQVFVKKINP